MTGAPDDPELMRRHPRTQKGLKQLAERLKNPEDDFRLVVVVNICACFSLIFSFNPSPILGDGLAWLCVTMCGPHQTVARSAGRGPKEDRGRH